MLSNPLQFLSHIKKSCARTLKFSLQLVLAPSHGRIVIYKALENSGEFLGALRQLGDFVLAVHFYPSDDIERGKGKNGTRFISDYWRVGNRSFDQILVFRGTVRPDE